jgi:transposase
VGPAAGTGSKKKSLIAREQDRPDVKARRDAWHEALKATDPDTIVFLDESGARTDMTRTRGRAPKGIRVVEKVPAGHWTTTTMLAAVRTAGPLAGAMVGRPTDTDVFLTWIEHSLVPALRPGETVVMDNLSPHKNPRVRDWIESAGCRLLYLPPYSPDFNPIENLWSKVKSHLRSAAARTYDALQHAVTAALHAITPSDCQGFYRHCGYATTKAALL